MTGSRQLLPVIQSLECQLHSPAIRNNVKAVDELLHVDFEEIGRSGQCYNRQQTVTALERESSQVSILAEEFKLSIISHVTVLLTYRSFQRDADGGISRHALRSSLWLLSDNRWQIRFHQATPAEDSR